MKKKMIIIATIIILIVVCFILFSRYVIGYKPFENLDVKDIQSVTVKLLPPNTEMSLDEDDIINLVDILHEVVVYNKDSTFVEYNGQAVIYTITKLDDTQIVINAYNPFIIIDDTGYKTKYEPCEQLNVLGNNVGVTI